MAEIWKPTSHTDAYEISSHGRLRFAKTKSIRTLGLKEGKFYASFVAHGKDVKCNIARQVLIAFVRHPQLGENAHHKNGILTNNNVENLEWRTGATKKQETTAVIVTREDTREKRRFDSPNEAAKYVKKSRTTIFHNFGKGFVKGFKYERELPKAKNVAIELGVDEIIKEIMFGDHVIEVTDGGKVKVDSEGPWRKPEVLDRGYIRTTFQFDKDGNTKRNSKGEIMSQAFDLHRLVCQAFHGPPPVGKGDVNHKDHDKSNNHPDNLEWVSRSENMTASYAVGGNVSANENVTYKYIKGGIFTGDFFRSASEAARSVPNGDVAGIVMCCSGTRLSHKNFEWSYDAPSVYDTTRDALQAKAKELNKEAGRKNREKKGPVKSTGKPIYAYDKDTLELHGSYPSGKAAAADTGCNTANISSCASVNGKLEWTGRFIFSRLDEEAFRAERGGK